jgi:polyhydroxyalkanoate synthesis repressor PhaR
MVIIKRYPNRKLYDTNEKQYITLDGIADLIREGKEVQVLDHTTGEDLTAVTLSQIIFEQEKKQSGFVPRSVLTGMIKAGGDTLTTLRRALASPLEMLTQVDEEIVRRMEDLVERGEIAEEEGQRLLEKLLAQSAQFVSKTRRVSEEEIQHFLAERGVPTQDDIDRINRKLDDLSVVLDEALAQVEETQADNGVGVENAGNGADADANS